MKKTTYCFHGTTLENAQKLAKNGWDWATPNRPDVNWLCSFPLQVCAWCGIWTAKNNGDINGWDEFTGSNEEAEGNWEAIRFAFENAQVAAAIQDFRGDTLVVLGYKEKYEYENPEDDFEVSNLSGPWYLDYSCQSMDGAVQSHVGELVGRKPDIIIICKGYNPIARGVLLPIKNEYFPEDRFSETEKAFAWAMHNNERLFEEVRSLISSKNWEEKTIEELLQIEE